MIKCILFDRDGTLGELGDKRYPQSFRPYDDIPSFFARLHRAGYLVGIITNQSSIARGTGLGYDFSAEFSSYGVDAFEICPHDDKDNCDCRKPKSGLLLAVCKTLSITPKECVVVGDRLSDIACAINVGAAAVLVETGYGKNELEQVKKQYPNVPVCAQFTEILNVLNKVKP